MRILYLTLADVDDRSFGGALRSVAVRAGLQQAGSVETLVIHGGPLERLDADWNGERVRTAIFSRAGFSLAALRQRRRTRAWVDAILRETAYDLVVAHYLGLATYLPRRAWSRLVLDADDLLKRPSVDASLPKRARLSLRNAIARWMAKRARHVWVVNPREVAALGARSASPLSNAIALPPLDRPRAAALPKRLLMVGYFDHPPNAEGLRFFAAEVLPELARRFPGIELHAVGKHPLGFERGFAPPVRVRGFVDDLAAEYDRAALVVAPIISGAGTQIKVLDALAHERPLVASAFTQAGYATELHADKHLLVAGAVDEWLARCTWALQHPEAAEAMARRGGSVVRRIYGSERMAGEVERSVREVAASLKEDR